MTAEELWNKKACEDWKDNGPEKPVWLLGCNVGLDQSHAVVEENRKLREGIQKILDLPMYGEGFYKVSDVLKITNPLPTVKEEKV